MLHSCGLKGIRFNAKKNKFVRIRTNSTIFNKLAFYCHDKLWWYIHATHWLLGLLLASKCSGVYDYWTQGPHKVCLMLYTVQVSDTCSWLQNKVWHLPSDWIFISHIQVNSNENSAAGTRSPGQRFVWARQNWTCTNWYACFTVPTSWPRCPRLFPCGSLWLLIPFLCALKKSNVYEYLLFVFWKLFSALNVLIAHKIPSLTFTVPDCLNKNTT